MEEKRKFEEMIEDLEAISKEYSKILEDAEKRISILIKDNNNNIVEESFEAE